MNCNHTSIDKGLACSNLCPICLNSQLQAAREALEALEPYIKEKYGIPEEIVCQFEPALAKMKE